MYVTLCMYVRTICMYALCYPLCVRVMYVRTRVYVCDVCTIGLHLFVCFDRFGMSVMSCMYVMCVCYVCRLCRLRMYVVYVSYVCMSCVYVYCVCTECVYECYLCMMCMYAMYVCMYLMYLGCVCLVYACTHVSMYDMLFCSRLRYDVYVDYVMYV